MLQCRILRAAAAALAVLLAAAPSASAQVAAPEPPASVTGDGESARANPQEPVPVGPTGPSARPGRPAPDDLVIPTLGSGLVRRAETRDEVATTLEILFLLTILTLAPTILIMTTAFSRIVIVLSFLRRALSTQELPPNQIVIGLALILTFLVMAPTWRQVHERALRPYFDGDISQREAVTRGVEPIREFMFAQLRRPDELRMFYDIAGAALPRSKDEVPLEYLVPAFVLSELKKAFEMGFLLYLPFVVIDLVVSSILISMGMLVLPPILISLPLKILIFVLVDGWTLVVGEVVRGFH